MNTVSRESTSKGVRTISKKLVDRVLPTLFGDRIGLCVFLATVAAFMIVWRVEFTISDNYTLANGLAAVANGHLHVDEPLYTPSLNTPGMSLVQGQAYPKNFGQIFFALPFLWIVQALSVFVYPRIAFAAIWSVVVLWLFVIAGRELGQEKLGNTVASAAGLALFSLSFLMYRPLPADQIVYSALQMSTITLAGFSCVILYRILSRMYGSTVGLVAGFASGLATPTLLWASVPKRHVPMAMLVLMSLYFLYRSREVDGESENVTFRILAYAPVGLATWILSAEGLILMVALILADVLTAQQNDLRTLVKVGATLIVSLLPFFLTNMLVVGNPVEPPRMWPDFDPAKLDASRGENVRNGGTSPNGNGGDDGGFGSAIPSTISKSLFFVDLLVSGLQTVIRNPIRLLQSYVHMGYLDQGPKLAIDLAYIESMPIIGAVFSAPLLAVRQLRKTTVQNARTSTDLFVGIYTVLLTLFYLNYLPIHTMFTVRYLFPLFPLGVYALVRLPWVRTVLTKRTRLLTFTYAFGVLLGGQLMLAAFVRFRAPIDVGTQAFAYLSLGFAGALLLWSFFAASGRNYERAGTLLLGLAGAVTTDFILILSMYYFQSEAVLPLVPSF